MVKPILPATQLMTSIQTHDADTTDSMMSDVEINGDSQNKSNHNRDMLSRVSLMYDVNGDGVLDEAERAMRNLDTTGRGYLTNDKVYALMDEHIKMQKDLFRFKKVVIGLIVFVVLLALTNLGTSFAAAYLAKDTTTNGNNELVDTKLNEAVSTQTTSDAFDYTRALNEKKGARRLCTKQNGIYTCETDSYLNMPYDEGVRMVGKCKKGKTVDLKRAWHDGSETIIHLCPTTRATYSQRETRFDNGVTMTISDDGNFYELKGDVLTQDEDDVCDESADCDSGLVCKDNLQAIDACKRHCDRLRFGPQRLQGCYDSCVFRSCQASSTQG
eukprot:CCRYP_020791-RA/>CCRYP_020791-RA protein AED:0.18 eAED:0.18 QI:195/1/1/1/1/1/3/1680/327